MEMGSAGLGGVLMTSSEKIIEMFARKAVEEDVEILELRAIMQAIAYLTKSKPTNEVSLIVESDSKVATSWILSPCSRPWRLHTTFTELDAMIQGFKELTVQYISRGANGMADNLAKIGAAKEKPFFANWE